MNILITFLIILLAGGFFYFWVILLIDALTSTSMDERIKWIVMIMLVPIVGPVMYYLKMYRLHHNKNDRNNILGAKAMESFKSAPKGGVYQPGKSLDEASSEYDTGDVVDPKNKGAEEIAQLQEDNSETPEIINPHKK